MEVFRGLGVEEEALADGVPSSLMGDTVFATSLVGEEIGRIRTWGTGDESLSEYAAASPCAMIDLPRPTWSRSWSRRPPSGAPPCSSTPS